ncbi:hypothetical protein LXG23DRAFT_48495 [Yarrowia lipolytica]|uniref:Uncharacterized protein n=1 Tax=Yarrowia lipolytica TaxID=4952 RepID=A0A1D8NFC7_YARLL|nr:hypothetical protein YALI1_D25233g [Yarrowia lipolytica]KAB8285831.1 hypothetical protein BKA91DRAFT_132988 [Yarrowia lipolytica]KAE8171826.1 hypothetical protein BKA90DRAFT_138299 [Yarrowia lipolytica]KAJ8054167.1 hypothetical protein LXG23DRAFT_48495 [Yarrowia lipolytica]RMI99467.1 hypothetical protein BD777DRAFT_124077 [Yarrowia lipolytica]
MRTMRPLGSVGRVAEVVHRSSCCRHYSTKDLGSKKTDTNKKTSREQGADHYDRIFAFMDGIPPATAESIIGRSSTRDRVSHTGERIRKLDFDVEDLIKPGRREVAPAAPKRESKQPGTKSLMTVLSKQLEKEHLKFQGQQRELEWSNKEAQHKKAAPVKTHTPQWQETPSSIKTVEDQDYAYVTQGGEAIFTKERPPSLASEDLFSVLNRNPHPETYAKSINKLESKGWRYIGCGYPSDLVVFARPKRRRYGWIKQIMGTSALAFVVTYTLLEIDERWTGTKRRAQWEREREQRRRDHERDIKALEERECSCSIRG